MEIESLKDVGRLGSEKIDGAAAAQHQHEVQVSNRSPDAEIAEESRAAREAWTPGMGEVGDARHPRIIGEGDAFSEFRWILRSKQFGRYIPICLKELAGLQRGPIALQPGLIDAQHRSRAEKAGGVGEGDAGRSAPTGFALRSDKVGTPSRVRPRMSKA